MRPAPCSSVCGLGSGAEEARARRYMRKPVTINIGSAGKATDNVTQHIIIAKDNDKPRLLEDWINEARPVRSVLPYPTLALPSSRASEACLGDEDAGRA
jgi:superfamily II DNA/RNA helicase